MKTTINNNKIVIINGIGGSGKDTFVEFCKKYYPKVMNKSSVDYVKNVAFYCGWDGTKSEKNRKFLSDLKDILTEWNDIPFKRMEKFIYACNDQIIFLHIREPEEIKKMKNKYDAMTLLIKNPNVKHIDSNHADSNVEKYDYDYIVNNDGTLQDLEDSAKKFMEYIGG